MLPYLLQTNCLQEIFYRTKSYSTVISATKKIAVETELPDTLKRAAITKKTGFNIDNAIMVNRVMDEPIVEEKNEEKVRRTAPISTSEETKTRRANLPKYNVVNIKTN
jgi:hypothetical protein